MSTEMTELVKPVLTNDEFLTDVKASSRQTDEFHLWWLGQSGFLLQWNGRHLLFDPYLSDSLTKKYAATDKPHVRMTEIVVAPARLDFIDVVTSSHNHTDHLDPETLLQLISANPNLQLVIPEANRTFVADRLKCDPNWPVGSDDGESARLGDFQISGLAAAHEEIEFDDEGRCTHLGYIVSFGDFTVYHAGDNKGFDGMAEEVLALVGDRKIDVALLPINGRKPERRVPGNFWGHEAAKFAKDISAKLAIPMHFEMFTFNTETPDEFVATCQQLNQPFRVLRCGERWSHRSS